MTIRYSRDYKRIFARVGIPEIIAVASDSGMMGGNVSHEFILLTPVGEDTVVICKNCGYSANIEAAEYIVSNKDEGTETVLTKVYTPGMKTIEDVCRFLDKPVQNSCKAVAYQKDRTGEYVVVFIRGDLDVNETKVARFRGIISTRLQFLKKTAWSQDSSVLTGLKMCRFCLTGL